MGLLRVNYGFLKTGFFYDFENMGFVRENYGFNTA